jgi:hypothetical protein
VAEPRQAVGASGHPTDGLRASGDRASPQRGDAAALEATVAASMSSGVLVGLLIVDSALPADELNLPVSPGGP